jgi:lysophospholipid acyltransferase (LPLAT)-like uncharacterized protein
VAFLLAVLVRLLARSWRVRRPPWPFEGAAVVAIRHGDLVPLLGTHLDRGYVAMVSASRDGERLVAVLARLGFHTVRGSSSRGGVRALLGARRALAEGRCVIVAVDGPRGPVGSVAAGVGALARTAPVIVATAQARGLRLPTWDQALIPWPFARVVVRYDVVSGDVDAVRRALAG